MNLDIITILAILNSIIFTLISAVHFYWALGGQWGAQQAIPESYKAHFFNPKYKLITMIASIGVGIGLACFSLLMINQVYPLGIGFLERHGDKLSLSVGFIFLIRAVGDFNLFGLFRKKKDTLFNEMDRKLYVPLCLFLGMSCILIGI